MKTTICSAAVFLLCFSSIPPLSAHGACEPSDDKGDQCTLNVEDLRPTQFAVGSIAVDCKAASISKKSKKKLKKYLDDEARYVPAVIGPDGKFYITDHHHLATALYRAKSPDWGSKDKVLNVNIIDKYDFKKTSWAEFWSDMLAQHRTYNYDEKGTPYMDFALLPKDVGDLLNDPYRTLSRWVRESCGYVKLGKTQCDKIRPNPPHAAPYFMEFYWGVFFRKELPLDLAKLEVCKSIPYSSICLNDEAGQLKGIYDQAMQLAGSDKAKAYFESLGLDPYAYGYNDTGEHVKVSFDGACEEVEGDDD